MILTLRYFLLSAFAASTLTAAQAQQQPASDPVAVRWVQTAVDDQLASDRNDKTRWCYTDHDVQPPGKDVVDLVAESPQGDLHRTIIRNGKPLTPAETQAETDRLNIGKHDVAGQAKAKKASLHDDEEASNMLRHFPVAFLWSVHSETPELITLDYKPNAAFSASTMASKVMSQMTGQMVVQKKGGHLYTMKGHLTQDVTLLFGLVKLKAGGWFDVQRREVGPGHWQIVEQHTHMDGRALLFKTVGQQEDETKTDFRLCPTTSLLDAGKALGADK
jgi:hypothetical protein